MAQVFKLPDLGEGIHEGEIVDVLVAEGDQVNEGQPFLVVETDKATTEIPSPFSGKVQEIKVKPGDLVKVGSVLMVFGDRETAEADGRGAPHAKAPSRERQGQMAEKAAAGPADGTDKLREGPVPASPATRRLARELGVDLHRVPASGPAGLVTAQDVRAFAGRQPRAGEPSGATAPTAEPREQEPAAEQIRTLSAEAPPLPDFRRWGEIERVPLRSIRRATATHMALAWSQIPHVNHQETVDVTELEAFRRQHVADVEAHGGKLTMMVFVLKAAVAALKAFPRFNASLDPASQEIIFKRYYHLNVAVDTDRGLVVPAIRDVDRKSVAEIASELSRLTQRTREGEVSPEELQGGTFTITNIGALGGTGFAPIVNYPQVAILGIGKARLQPVVLGNLEQYEIVPRLMMPLILAFDHRVSDGADAARFTNMIKEMLESPGRLWLNI